MINIKKLIRSFKVAGEGLVHLFKTEQNFRIEILGVLIVVVLMMYIQPTTIEVAILIIVTVSVLVMESMNTVLERLLDILTKRRSKNFKVLKDTMAAAVLLNAIVAVIVAIIILGKYFVE
jgi:diacylglycerol kinase (ATP)